MRLPLLRPKSRSKHGLFHKKTTERWFFYAYFCPTTGVIGQKKAKRSPRLLQIIGQNFDNASRIVRGFLNAIRIENGDGC